MIGHYWLSEIETRKDEVDYVVKEISYALKSGKKIIPVLLDDTRMPDKIHIPDEITGIHLLNAVNIELADYNNGLDQLKITIDNFLRENQQIKKVLLIDENPFKGAVVLGILKTFEQRLNVYIVINRMEILLTILI